MSVKRDPEHHFITAERYLRHLRRQALPGKQRITKKGIRIRVVQTPHREITICTIIPTCAFAGCTNLVHSNIIGPADRRWFNRYCNKHIKKATREQESRSCAICGWQGECAIHTFSRDYQGDLTPQGQMVFLCPNCKAAAEGKGDYNDPQQSLLDPPKSQLKLDYIAKAIAAYGGE